MKPVPTPAPQEGEPIPRRDLRALAAFTWTRLMRLMRQHGPWRVAAWVLGVPAVVFWFYSGMPMICH